MPSVSKKQHNFFEYIANTPGAAKKTGVPQNVAREFIEADKAKKKKGKK